GGGGPGERPGGRTVPRGHALGGPHAAGGWAPVAARDQRRRPGARRAGLDRPADLRAHGGAAVTADARASWRETLAVVLLLGLPLLAMQLLRPVPRLDADAVEYYSHVRSLYFDGDLDFANEFHHFGILARYDKIVPTVTGHRRTVFSIGPALLWMPFYAAGDLVARARGDVQDGYSPAHIRAVCLGSL